MSDDRATNGKKEINEDSSLEESIHFTQVMRAFRCYKKDALSQISRSEKSFLALSSEHQQLLPDHMNMLDRLRCCVEQNNAICLEIVKNCGNAFQNRLYQESEKDDMKSRPRPMDLDKVRTTLKQIMRDWSVEGRKERNECYQPIINEITSRLPLSSFNNRNPNVLVPGCGLGRLAWELAHRGYDCQGNEFSFYMLFTSDFVLNRTQNCDENGYHQFTIYPWATQKCNVSSWDAIMAPIKFPDVNPASLPPNARFSMAAGDFLECYVNEKSWDCVATCYFIDTAHNIISYIERIFHILVPGGIWVNLGPLLYHYSGLPNESSVEFSYEQVIEIIKKVGFEIVKDERNITTSYIDNSSSMLQYSFKCGFMVAIKPK